MAITWVMKAAVAQAVEVAMEIFIAVAIAVLLN
jgi:hypothetical protein